MLIIFKDDFVRFGKYELDSWMPKRNVFYSK